MAASFTHYLYLKEELKISDHSILLGGQGADPLFFYGYLNKKLENKQKVREFGTYLHHISSKKILEIMLEYLKDNYSLNLDNYILGYLNHYLIDSATHPYVFYHTGIDYKENQIKHTTFETAIDVSYQKLLKAKYNRANIILDIGIEELKEISKLYHYLAIKLEFSNIDDDSFYESVKCFRKVLSIMESRFGIKKFFLNLFLNKSIINALCHPLNVSKKIDYLNLKSTIWVNPFTNEKRTDTFLELVRSSKIAFDRYLEVKNNLDLLDFSKNNDGRLL